MKHTVRPERRWPRALFTAGLVLLLAGVGLAANSGQSAPDDLLQLVESFGSEGGLLLVASLMVGTLVSEDLTCIAAGLLVAQGRITFGAALLGCTAGIFLGDVGLFLAGRWLGRPIIRHAPVRWFLSSESLERASGWFERQGPRAIFLSRFMPGLRLPTYFAAGVLKTGFLRFTAYFLLAVLVWTPLLVGFAVIFGQRALELIDEWGGLALVAAVLAMLFIERVVVRLFTFRGRRALLGSWKRLTQWQHWPRVVFYPPIMLYVTWLALRHRSLLLVTAVNPGIPTGGLIGESKSEILDGLDHSTGFIARYQLLRSQDDEETRVEAALAFAGDCYPVIFKPEVGQRGSGVVVVQSAAELERLARSMGIDHIVQEYVRGPEYGLFYLREPGAERGRLYSVTEKRLPVVVGDGEHTIEHLILSNRELVAAAPHYLRAQASKLQEVPLRGEHIQLAELGTHSRGAQFLDGARLVTPALEASIEALSRSFEGFHFGRFDVRAESEEALRAGRGFKVLELNGMTSEATHIYDPATPLCEAYRVLCEQWRLAFEIAAANRAAGAKPSSWREVTTELFGYRKKQRSHFR